MPRAVSGCWSMTWRRKDGEGWWPGRPQTGLQRARLPETPTVAAGSGGQVACLRVSLSLLANLFLNGLRSSPSDRKGTSLHQGVRHFCA